jgi:phosphoglycerate-specific signal transduction histidine kinase
MINQTTQFNKTVDEFDRIILRKQKIPITTKIFLHIQAICPTITRGNRIDCPKFSMEMQ